MDENKNNQLVVVPPGWTEKEVELLAATESIGARPIAVSLAANLFNLFLEGYSCAEIARQGKGLSEGDILFCRRKYQWDDKRDQYLFDLQTQAQNKLLKQKFESIVHLTDMMAVLHKEQKDQMLKFLQTGAADDFPKFQSIKFYKDIIETLAKVTGEDKVQKHKVEGTIQNNTTVTTVVGNPADAGKQKYDTSLQSKLLRAMAKTSTSDGKE